MSCPQERANLPPALIARIKFSLVILKNRKIQIVKKEWFEQHRSEILKSLGHYENEETARSAMDIWTNKKSNDILETIFKEFDQLEEAQKASSRELAKVEEGLRRVVAPRINLPAFPISEKAGYDLLNDALRFEENRKQLIKDLQVSFANFSKPSLMKLYRLLFTRQLISLICNRQVGKIHTHLVYNIIKQIAMEEMMMDAAAFEHRHGRFLRSTK